MGGKAIRILKTFDSPSIREPGIHRPRSKWPRDEQNHLKLLIVIEINDLSLLYDP